MSYWPLFLKSPAIVVVYSIHIHFLLIKILFKLGCINAATFVCCHTLLFKDVPMHILHAYLYYPKLLLLCLWTFYYRSTLWTTHILVFIHIKLMSTFWAFHLYIRHPISPPFYLFGKIIPSVTSKLYPTNPPLVRMVSYPFRKIGISTVLTGLYVLR